MDLLLRRREIMMAATVPSEQLIYSLSDYTCDGTVNTFIDTGIRLFCDYESFRIELEYDNLDLTTQQTLFQCKSIHKYTTYTSCGTTLQVDNRSRLIFNFIPLEDEIAYTNASSAHVSITYTGGDDNSIVVNGNATTFSGMESVLWNTLTIGGRYDSTNTPENFVSCHIISLKIYATPISFSDIIYSLTDYTCDGTEATAINTGLYLFDTSIYPNGFAISFDFTVGENNVSQGSYLRCRNSTSPYNGIAVRRGDNNNSAKMQVQVSDTSVYLDAATAGTRHNITITNSSGCYLLVDGGRTGIRTSTPTNVISPLVIGGELSNDTTQAWNTSRFSKIYIHSLIIRAL